jgi:drug/metabolite transporter (DMT)-like permease
LTEEKAPANQRILAGILFMCGAGLLFPVMGGFAKFLGEAGYNSLQVSWARAFGHLVFMMAFFVPRFGLRMLRTRRPFTQLVRSAMLFTSNATNFLAIIYIPLAKSASISLMAPLFVLVLAWMTLGERTTAGRLVAIFVGFAGVLIVIRPGTELFHWASLLVVVSAAGYAVYQVLTRLISAIDPPETSAIYSSVVGGFGMFAVLPFVWARQPARHPVLLRHGRTGCARPLFRGARAHLRAGQHRGAIPVHAAPGFGRRRLLLLRRLSRHLGLGRRRHHRRFRPLYRLVAAQGLIGGVRAPLKVTLR